MKTRLFFVGAVSALALAGTLVLQGGGPAAARAEAASPPEAAALKAEIDALRRLVPSQSHAMADVDYHFANLWFAARSANWPLAAFYLNETRSHLNWTVRIRPVRRLSGGGALELKPMLEAIEGSGLADLRSAIGKRDSKAFETAYRQTITECYACHKAAEKPYLRPHIPDAPATRMINLDPKADWPQ